MSIRPPRTLAISPPESDAPTLDAWLRELLGSGVDAVQIRRKQSCDAEVLAATRRARERLESGVALLVNARADLALVAEADGVHLPAAGVPTSVARSCLSSTALIGRSTHALAETEAAGAEGADYVTFGPVYSTPSKQRYGAPTGLEALAEACRIGIPVLALGGVTTIERARACLAAGAWGIAAIRLFTGAVGADRVALSQLWQR